MKRTTSLFGKAEFQALDRIQKRWGVRGQSAAIRLAIRVVSRSLPEIDQESGPGGKKKMTSFFVADDDTQALRLICNHYGFQSHSPAIRFALRALASSNLRVTES